MLPFLHIFHPQPGRRAGNLAVTDIREFQGKLRAVEYFPHDTHGIQPLKAFADMRTLSLARPSKSPST